MARKKKTPKKPSEDVVIKEYFFAFEIIKKYPYSRSYVLKAPLKKSFKDTISELFVGRI